MKRLGRVLPAAAVFLLGALGFAVAGCSKQPGAQPGEPLAATKTACSDRVDGIPVTVFVKWENGQATTANKVIYLCKDKDWVEWVSCDGDFEEPVFSAGSPFDPNDKHDRKEKKLKSPKAKNVGGFIYTMYLVLPDKTKHIVDPRIEVVP
jgi:hypothetical protein